MSSPNSNHQPETSTQIEPDPNTQEVKFRWAILTSAINILFAAVLLTAAGTLNWSAGVVFIGILFINQFLSWEFVINENPQLAEERSSLDASLEAPWDRRLAGFMALIGPLVVLLLAGLDYRLGWTPKLPGALRITGLLLAAGGSILTIWAMHCNPFFYGHVRVEPSQDHHAIADGPYGILRHPGYAGVILFHLGTPLILGSVWSFIPSGLIWIVTIIRTRKEDQFLKDYLDTYQEYAQQVRYRLLPGIW